MEGTELSAADKRAELEKLVWSLTGWQSGATEVERLLRAADEYADARCREAHHITPVRLGMHHEVGVRDGELVEVSLVDAPSRFNGVEDAKAAITGYTDNSRIWTLADGSTVTKTWPDAKRCTKCELIKLIDEFNFDRSTRDGHAAYCRQCARRTQKKNLTGKEM